MSQILLDTLVYKPHQLPDKEDTVVLPLLNLHNINHAISIGPLSSNMAEAFNFDMSDIPSRISDFLKKNNLSPYTQSYTSIVPNSNDSKLQDILKRNTTNRPIEIPADGIFTRLETTPLIHKPADCPTAIMYAKNIYGEKILGLIHLGRSQVNNRITEKSLEHLIKKYVVDLATLIIGITPGIGPKHYFVKRNDLNTKKLLNLSYWEGYAMPDQREDEEILRIDITGKIISVLKSYGIDDTNIQAYGHTDSVDTYTLASQNPPLAYSHRYAVSSNQPYRNGRMMVAVQL